MVEHRYEQEMVKRPLCPFCGSWIEKPQELRTRMPGEMPVGACSCGAVYACDETGHNLGAALLEALYFACSRDTDLATDLVPEEDYQEHILEHYDIHRHLIVPGGVLESRRISGALFFIKMREEVLEVTAESVKRYMETSMPPEPPEQDKGPGKETYSKQEIEALVKDFKVGPILSVVHSDKRLLTHLQRLLYSGDDLSRKRAAEILGKVCGLLAEHDPGKVSKLLQRLFTAISDTAAFTWGAFEAIGQIIAARPDLFAGYLPQLLQFVRDAHRRAQALQALGQVARERADVLRRYTFYIIPYLQDSGSEVRAYTAWLLGNLGAHEARDDLEKLLKDKSPVSLYDRGALTQTTVGRLAAEALTRISAQG